MAQGIILATNKYRGRIPLQVNGTLNRLPIGELVDLSASVLEALANANIDYVYDDGSGGGGLALTRRLKTAAYAETATAGDVAVFCAGAFTVTLPSAVGNAARLTYKVTTGGPIVLVAPGQTVEGGSSYSIPALSGITVASDGANWWVTENVGSGTVGASLPTITVNPSSLPAGTIGTAYSQSVSGSGGTSYTYAVTAGSLPTGLALNASTGAITGTPTTAQTATFTITATDVSTATGARAYSVAIAAAGVSTALSASTLTRTSGATTYPPTVSFTRPIDWQDGDKAVMQWSTDYTFATGVSETATPVTLTAAVTTYNFGLSAIVSGVYYMRLGAWSGTRPGSLNWSNLQGVGDAVAPTITGNTATTPNNAVMAATVTASEVSYFTLGGADAASLEKFGAEPATSITVRLLANGTTSYVSKASYTFTVTPTDVSGNVGAAATFVRNVAAPMVLDAANKYSGLTLSNANKTMTGIGGNGAPIKVRSTNPVSGKGYFEFKFDTKTAGSSPGVGLVRASYAAYGDFTTPYATADVINGYFRDAFTNIDGPSSADIDITSTVGAVATNGIVGVAFDTSALLMWISVNGVFFGNPAAGTGGRTIPTGTIHAFAYAWNADVMTFRPDAASQTYAAPSGFTAIGA